MKAENCYNSKIHTVQCIAEVVVTLSGALLVMVMEVSSELARAATEPALPVKYSYRQLQLKA